MQRVGMPVNKQPKNRHFQDQALLPGEKGCGNKGDLLGVSLTLMVELDVTFDLSTGRTGRAQGAHREQVNVSSNGRRPREGIMQRRVPQGTPLLPWRTRLLRGDAQEQIKLMVDEACSHGPVESFVFVRNFKTELSVATVKRNALVLRAPTCQLARKTEKAFQKGASCPHAELG